MRELSAEARLHLHARHVAARGVGSRATLGFHTFALYGSLALIAAILFGTLSIHLF